MDLIPQSFNAIMTPDPNIPRLGRAVLTHGQRVNTGHWQAIKDVPQTKTIEVQNAVYTVDLPGTILELQELVTPNLPWAEDHFQERVGGVPLNPGREYKNWPWFRGNVATHQTVKEAYQKVKATGLLDPNIAEQFEELQQEPQFSHSYMERFWPRWAGTATGTPISHIDLRQGGGRGIRYRYGDLNDVIALLAREPHTRQAVLPVFFPEDTGAHHGERIPCSLYYHFMLRDGRLNINYTIRSCDFLRHFRDDVYMAGRLCQWMLNELDVDLEEGQPNSGWEGVKPGVLTMMMHSLHIFEGDLPKMRREYG